MDHEVEKIEFHIIDPDGDAVDWFDDEWLATDTADNLSFENGGAVYQVEKFTHFIPEREIIARFPPKPDDEEDEDES